MRKTLTVVVVVVASLATAQLGSVSSAVSPPKIRASATEKQTRVVCTRPSKASSAEKRKCYVALMRSRGSKQLMAKYESAHVAANLCDNSLADMDGYLSTMTGLDGLGALHSPRETVVIGQSTIDAYCPSARKTLKVSADFLLGQGLLTTPPRYK